MRLPTSVDFSVFFPPSIAVDVTGDTMIEPDETFFVNLAAPVNATIADSQATATIRNDD